MTELGIAQAVQRNCALTMAKIKIRGDQSGTGESSSSQAGSENAAILVLLRSPTLSDLCKKRKIEANPPPLGRKRAPVNTK